jgi:hypothetical protein
VRLCVPLSAPSLRKSKESVGVRERTQSFTVKTTLTFVTKHNSQQQQPQLQQEEEHQMGDESNVASFTPSIVAKDSSHLATQSIANLDPTKVTSASPPSSSHHITDHCTSIPFDVDPLRRVHLSLFFSFPLCISITHSLSLALTSLFS